MNRILLINRYVVYIAFQRLPSNKEIKEKIWIEQTQLAEPPGSQYAGTAV